MGYFFSIGSPVKAFKAMGIILIILACSIFTCSAVLAGVVVERQFCQATEAGKDTCYRLKAYFQDNKVKTQEPNGDSTIFDLNKGTLTVINPSKKQYSVASIDDMLARMEKGMNRFKKRLEGLPPKQRAMIEQLLGMSTHPAPPLQLKKVGGTEKIAGFDATHYVVTSGKAKVAEYWVSKGLRKELLKELDKDKIEKYEETMAKITRQMDFFGKSGLGELMKYEEKLQKDGEMVKEIHYPGIIPGQEDERQQVVSVKEQDIPPSAFQVPSGYKKVEFFKRPTGHGNFHSK